MITAWEVTRTKGIGLRRASAAMARLSATFIVIPLVIYTASYTPWFADTHRYNPPLCVDERPLAKQWLCYQHEVFNFHQDLEKFSTKTKSNVTKTEPAHPYFGEGYSWPWIGRPVAHAYETAGTGDNERAFEVLGLPNPAIWWLAFLEVPLLVWWTLRRRDPVAAFLLSFFVAGYVPYLFADLVSRPVFLFYATPLVPFLVLTVVHSFVRLVHRFPGAYVAAIGYVVVASTVFVYFYPVLAAYPISTSGPLGWRARMWFGSDCTVADRIKLFCWI
jgi:dolichyl-phosphate-mannose-protein mannosyltransferase